MGPRSVQRQRDAYAEGLPVPMATHRRRAPRALAVLGVMVILLLPAPSAAATADRSRRHTRPSDRGPGRHARLDRDARARGRGARGGGHQREAVPARHVVRAHRRTGTRTADRAGHRAHRGAARRACPPAVRLVDAGVRGAHDRSQAAALRADPSVASVVPDAPASIAVDSIPLGIERIGATDGITAGEDADIDVAVIDTGVGPVGGPAGAPRAGHPGRHRLPAGAGGPYRDAGSFADGHGHGTHVAGTIAARANGVGVVGVAPGARIWAVRVFDWQRRAAPPPRSSAASSGSPDGSPSTPAGPWSST